MIRVFTIFCKLNFDFSALKLFLSAMEEFSVERLPFLDLPCPFCGAKHPKWSYYASYSRFLISFEKGKIVTYTINITRLICSSCKHTHAILPEIIIPYGSYSLIFILNVLRDYYSHSMTILSICNKYEISVSTLYAWKKLFAIHKKLWLGFLEDISKSCCDFLSSIPSASTSSELQTFFSNHGFSFLQGVFRTARFDSS